MKVRALSGILVSIGGPIGEADPVIPHVNGIIRQTNVTGYYSDTAILGNNDFVVAGATATPTAVLSLSADPIDGLLARYRADGTFDWKKTINFGTKDEFRAVTTDSTERVFVTANTHTTGPQDGATWSWLFEFSPQTGTQNWSLNYSYAPSTVTLLADTIASGDNLISVGGNYYPATDVVRPFLLVVAKSGTVVSATEYDAANHFFTSISPGDSGSSYFVGGISGKIDAGRTGVGCMFKVTTSAISWSQCDSSLAYHVYDVTTVDSKPHAIGPVAASASARNLTTIRRTSSGSIEAVLYYHLSDSPLAFGALASNSTTDFSTGMIASAGDIQNWTTGEAFDFPLDVGGAVVTVKYLSNGAVDWDYVYDEPTGGLIPYASILDGRPMHLIVGAHFTLSLTTLQLQPMVLRYDEL